MKIIKIMEEKIIRPTTKPEAIKGKFCINSAFIMRPRSYLASSIQS